MLVTPTLRQAVVPEREAALSFNRSSGYSPPLASTDEIFVAELDDQIVAATRLCNEHGILVLRGMRVLPHYQRKGIGSLLLQFVVAAFAGRSCHCLPFAHLAKLYQRAGFVVVSDSDAPLFLLERADRYRHKGEDILLMACK